ncbi:MAG TPA: TAXI family TRAP transporter solute-binding subunit [Hyphomicrobiaceae bacterium]|jgi:TRAP transporter TAXI family solute receptor|nr:TAXI family TRAP transporter solute-binding subunit [Hyphomicrobiaceae bacterium]
MLNRVLTTVAAVALMGMTASSAWSADPIELKWGTPPVGSSGHKALVALSNILNKEMPKYRISVLPTAGAITTVKGFATNELDGFYGSDVAYHEFATDTARFKGFKARVQRMPMQSFWSNTIEVGLAVHVRNKDKIKKWGDLAGKRVFTGPLPFDTRAQTERGLRALNVDFNYVQVDLATAGSQLESGAIDAMTIYTGSESAPPPWLSEASLAADWAVLNPSPEEIAELKKKGFTIAEVDPKVFHRDVHGDKVIELPFYYGFNVGLNVSEADVYQMLTIIEKNAVDLAKVDPTFAQIAKDMKGFERRGVESSVDLVPVHPGLAKWMREKGVWDAKWDNRIAK